MPAWIKGEVDSVGRPLSTESVIVYSYMDIQIFAAEGLKAMTASDRGKEARCFKIIISIAKLGAEKVEALRGERKASSSNGGTFHEQHTGREAGCQASG